MKKPEPEPTNYRERTGKTATMQIRLTEPEKQELQRAADHTRRSRASFVVWAALEKARETNDEADKESNRT